MLNKYSSAQCFLRALTTRLRKKVLRNLAIDLDRPKTVKIEALIKAILKEADGLRTEERYNTLVNAGNLLLAMAAKNGIWDAKRMRTAPLALGVLATRTTANANTTATVPVHKSDFNNLASKFKALSLSLLA